MNIEEQIKAIGKIGRDATLKGTRQMTLGKLIKLLSEIIDQDKSIYFDFGYFRPAELMSWRGSYDELSIDYSEDEAVSVKTFLEDLKACVSKEFTGYKGGEFTMNEDTPLWVAHYGSSGHTGVSGIMDDGYQVIIETRFMEY